MRYWANAVMITCALAVIAPAAAPAGEGETSAGAAEEKRPAVLTTEQMLAAVQKNWSRIEDISVSYSFKVTKGGFVGEDHTKAVVKGDKVYFDMRYAVVPTQPVHREVAYNGKLYTIHDPERKTAMFWPGYHNELRALSKGFFQMAMYDPPREDYHRFKPGGLVDALSSEQCRVRPMQENLDGHWCHVVEVINEYTKEPDLIVWIDPDRGYLPVKQQRANVEGMVAEAVEVEEGLWFPVSGVMRVQGLEPPPGHEDFPELYQGSEQVLQVARLEDGAYAIEINTGVEDEFFDLWKRVPDGTRVWDREADFVWTAGEGPGQDVAASLAEELVEGEGALPEQPPAAAPEEDTAGTSPHVTEKDTPAPAAPAEEGGGKTTALLILVALVVAAGLAGVAIALRRRAASNR